MAEDEVTIKIEAEDIILGPHGGPLTCHYCEKVADEIIMSPDYVDKICFSLSCCRECLHRAISRMVARELGKEPPVFF